ncbi:MAG: GIDE domain-containing protein [Candidatus Omnitrophota bacterium]|nr:GIDE domain-containing protein [Candidatus Omnitrophota bacterium]
MSDNRDVAYAAFGFVAGICAFFWGFNRLRRKRLIENIPTSTVRGMAMGLVEISGKAKKVTSLKSPLTQTECVLFQYKVEEYRKSGKSGSWVTIASGNSFDCPFWLEDETGKIMVFPKGAEFIWPLDFQSRTGFGIEMPYTLTNFMVNKGINYKDFFGVRPLRFSEWFICEGETVYALGSTKKREGTTKIYSEQIIRRIEKLKENKERTKEIDLNKDGQVSIEEWDGAVRKIEAEVLKEALNIDQADNVYDIIITKGDTEKIFIISDQSEKDLTKKLTQQSALGIYGGGFLSVATLAYVLFRLGFFN